VDAEKCEEKKQKMTRQDVNAQWKRWCAAKQKQLHLRSESSLEQSIIVSLASKVQFRCCQTTTSSSFWKEATK